MTVTARIDWIKRVVSQGIPASMSTTVTENGKMKVKLLVFHNRPKTDATVSRMLTLQLVALQDVILGFSTVDRGHRHAGTGVSEICIWISALAVPVAPRFSVSVFWLP